MQVDFLVIGSGIAGLSFALKAASLGKVLVVTKKHRVDTATNLAQGGVAAVLDSADSFASHVDDTLRSGAGLCDPGVVEFVVRNGPKRIRELRNLGVRFVHGDDGKLSLGREGGHSNRRVAHAFDLTGREIERVLLEQAAAEDSINLLENHICCDLAVVEKEGEAVCKGAYLLDQYGKLIQVHAHVVVLCTGGCGKVYLYTSNPDIATGDGVAIASRAGAKITNMEFVQFHPTCLYHLRAKNFLISEAVRGEGGLLVNDRGERFMEKGGSSKGELSTRDVVARAIDTEMKRSGADCVYLDITHKSRVFLEKRFPTIYNKCASLGIDISAEPIPVVPAAHYLCGGVVVDLHGRSSIKGLLALGETACTGLHGANRLASNSLLEALVYADSAFAYCKDNWPDIASESHVSLPAYDTGGDQDIDEEILINHNWDVIRRVMWNYVGIVRKKTRLERARLRLIEAKKEVEELSRNYRKTYNMLELNNISLVSLLIVEASLQRPDSVGLHYMLDS
jgi:L-aspartate oxidase